MSSSESSSAESSDYDDEESGPLYKDREDFADLTPIPQDDGKSAAVQIAYSEQFKDAYDYFRAIYTKNELSTRAYELTATCIALNPANYTVWEYRRQCVLKLKISIDEELEFTKKKMGR